MIRIAHPEYLVLGPVLLLLLRWKPIPQILFSAFSPLNQLTKSTKDTKRYFSTGLRYLILVSAWLALLQIQIADRHTRIPVSGIAIMLVVDVSPSMEETTFIWEGGEYISRLEAAKRTLKLFVQGGIGPGNVSLSGRKRESATDGIGLVTFAIRPETLCPITLDHASLVQIFMENRQRAILDTGTNIGDAIAEGILRLEQSGLEKKVLILFSDGEHNFDLSIPGREPLKPRQAAQLAANLNIPIYTIDTGGELPRDATIEQKKQRADGKKINQILAEMTKGKSFSADNANELLQVYQVIDQLGRDSILSFSYRRYYETYSYFLMVMIGSGVVLWLAEKTVWNTIP